MAVKMYLDIVKKNLLEENAVILILILAKRIISRMQSIYYSL